MSPTSERKFWGPFERLLWDWEYPSRSPDLASAVQDTFTKANQLTVSTVWVDANQRPLEALAHSQLWSEYKAAGGVDLLVVPAKEGDWLLCAWPTTFPSVYQLTATIPVTDDRWQRFERRLGKAFPRINRFILTEHELDNILGDLTKREGRLEVSRLSARMTSDYSSYTRGWPESSENLRPSYENVVVEIAGRASIRTITLHTQGHLSLHLRRLAGATYYGGDFAVFSESIVSPLAEAADRRRKLFSNKGRTRGVQNQTAVAIELDGPLFDDPLAIGDLMLEMVRPAGLGIAVLHRNPYFHAAVTDYIDGSNFDAFVTDGNHLVIHPGYTATAGALARFSQVVSDKFATRDLLEVAPDDPPTLEDLLTDG